MDKKNLSHLCVCVVQVVCVEYVCVCGGGLLNSPSQPDIVSCVEMTYDCTVMLATFGYWIKFSWFSASFTREKNFCNFHFVFLQLTAFLRGANSPFLEQPFFPKGELGKDF